LPYQSPIQRQGYGFRLERPDQRLDHVLIIGTFLTGGNLQDGDSITIKRGHRTRHGDIRAKAIWNERTKSTIRSWFWIPVVVPASVVVALWVAFVVFVGFGSHP
jgi:hypothetical protein